MPFCLVQSNLRSDFALHFVCLRFAIAQVLADFVQLSKLMAEQIPTTVPDVEVTV